MFGDLQNSIRNDVAKTPVPGGAVHYLIRYVLNYVKYACDYEDTLKNIQTTGKTQPSYIAGMHGEVSTGRTSNIGDGRSRRRGSRTSMPCLMRYARHMSDEIHKTQSTWVVREAQLLPELRASISGVVIPAYQLFVGRYKHHFEQGKSEKLIATSKQE
ncbi:hypothetical protein L1887_34158 [Cichorium endivia]|nr:hypothetical protein L1887_34158 [Cichorium endivia]